MPLFYFHLGLGSRLIRDEEGVELPDRAAAREEANAVTRDLSTTANGRSRLAGWFLRVADSQGHFLHLPFGRPALELIVGREEIVEAAAETSAPDFVASAPEVPATTLPSLVMCVLARKQHTAQLLEKNQQLRIALASVFSSREQTSAETSRLLESARQVRWGISG
jgi:Domain of unknown function (DUF6894)